MSTSGGTGGGGAPSGPAGGDLGSSYPNPTVTNLHLAADTAIGHKLTSVSAPTASGDASTKGYVDTAISGVDPAVSVLAATTAAADTSGLTYANGVAGVGATLTGTVNTALTFDGVTLTAVGQRVLVKNDTQAPSGSVNGVYSLTTLQSVGVAPVLTRAVDYNTPASINNTSAIPVVSGTANATTSWLLTTTVTTIGTDPLTYVKFSLPPAAVLQVANNLNDVATRQTALNNLAGAVTNNLGLFGDGTNVTLRAVATADLPNAGVTAAKIHQLPYCFLQPATHFSLPNNAWTPIPLDSTLQVDTDTNSFWPGSTANTTIAAGSNGNVLPQATINVASTAGFPSAGYLTINGPPGAGILTIVKYTGTSGGNQFTGCTLGTGTLATSQVVKAANVDLNINTAGAYAALVCGTFPAAGNTTGLLGVRLFQSFAVGTMQIGNPNVGLTISTGAQPVFASSGNGLCRAEIFQSSGAALTIAIDGIQAPSVALAFVSPP